MALVLASRGGDSVHLPTHSLQSVVSAYVEGADLVRLSVQASRDGVAVLYPYADLSETTDGQGSIADMSWGELRDLDAGYTFRPGLDYPWRKWVVTEAGRQRDKRHHRLTRFDVLVDVLEDEVLYALEFPTLEPGSPQWKSLIQSCLDSLAQVGADRPILCAAESSALDALRSHFAGACSLGYVVDDDEQVNGPQPDGIDYVFCPWNAAAGAPAVLAADGARIVVSVPSTADADIVSTIAQTAYAVESESVLTLAPVVRGSRLRFCDEFRGHAIDRDHWVAGVSSGYTNLHRAVLDAIDDRGKCEVQVYQDDALVIDVVEGYQYASGAAVTTFSIGGDFAVEVAARYENPQRATEFVLGAINATVFGQYHREGPIRHINIEDEHAGFDAHGMSPFVIVEREEADGSRIITNETASEKLHLRQTIIYNHDVGAGDSKDVELRIARRGHLFSGHYKDEKNAQWVGVGYVQNSSLNDRVYFRIAGKHYPKSGAPDPLPANRFTISRFCVRVPAS